MPEVEDECIFETTADQVQLLTKLNGDKITIKGLHLTQGEAASLAWLINAKDHIKLEFKVKIKGD